MEVETIVNYPIPDFFLYLRRALSFPCAIALEGAQNPNHLGAMAGDVNLFISRETNEGRATFLRLIFVRAHAPSNWLAPLPFSFARN